MPELVPELWILFPLAIAAGLDLYLTLLLLGAAPTLPWWDQPLPGALGDLDATSIVVVIGGMYVLEFLAERRPTSSLLWNAMHAFIRPVSGALLVALLLHGQSPGLWLAGSVIGGLTASMAHAVRSGGAILRWLDPGLHPSPLLVSIFEDVLVVGLVAASLDAPRAALAASGAVVLIGVPAGRSHVRAFLFATRLAAGRAFQSFRQRSWTPTEALPGWVRAALADDVLALGGGLRGARAGVLRMNGLPRFATGWVVVRGDDPVFVYGPRRGRGQRVALGPLTPMDVGEEEFFRHVDLVNEDGRILRMFFFVNGPSTAALAAEFGLPAPPPAAATAEKNL